MKLEQINKLPVDKTRKIIFILILVICIIAIGIAVYNQYYKDENLGVIIGINTKNEKEEEISKLKSNFNSIFNNTVIGEDNNKNYNKIDNEKNILYSNYIVNKENENYTLDIKLPYINLNSNIINNYNKEIKETFLAKAIEIIKSSINVNKIFSISYKGYIKDNILSIVIKGELKEGTNSQRVLIKTYNYDIENDKEIKASDLLEYKDITEDDANKKIKEEINQKQEKNKQLQELGYEIYNREYNEQIHTIKNTTEFFIDNNNNLYIIYPYGNSDTTSEMDIIIM